VDAGEDVNEVEAAGCTPLHNAAFDGWLEGCELLLGLGAKVGGRWGAAAGGRAARRAAGAGAGQGLPGAWAPASPAVPTLAPPAPRLPPQINASNNAGDTPWHWATNMGHGEVAELLVKVGGRQGRGRGRGEPDCGACGARSQQRRRPRRAM
jgi:ankyrin repeat protein